MRSTTQELTTTAATPTTDTLRARFTTLRTAYLTTKALAEDVAAQVDERIGAAPALECTEAELDAWEDAQEQLLTELGWYTLRSRERELACELIAAGVEYAVATAPQGAGMVAELAPAVVAATSTGRAFRMSTHLRVLDTVLRLAA